MHCSTSIIEWASCIDILKFWDLPGRVSPSLHKQLNIYTFPLVVSPRPLFPKHRHQLDWFSRHGPDHRVWSQRVAAISGGVSCRLALPKEPKPLLAPRPTPVTSSSFPFSITSSSFRSSWSCCHLSQPCIRAVLQLDRMRGGRNWCAQAAVWLCPKSLMGVCCPDNLPENFWRYFCNTWYLKWETQTEDKYLV